ncbi:MAG: methionyl-tRNA formyltransferase [Betaproteobacteria bacterium]|nr:methionyl-tRNA formyltransferase [Betaproteobacteria bacterium]MBI2509370.1 methionyl-tRNA formyltransferase [Betaproteobacteria bacterium]
MRIVFAGTPEFAAVSLAALLAAGHDVVLVLTQPDRPAGRGLKPLPSAVKRLAQSRGLALLQPAKLKEDTATLAAVTAAQPEAMAVVAYGLLVPAPLIALPRRGCLNVHASLLPRWRGAAPIQRALLAGDATTGVTIVQMDEGLDTGPILLQEAIPIAATDTTGTLHDRLATLGSSLLVRALGSAPKPRPQPGDGVTYAARIARGEAEIDWRRPAAEIERQVRAFDPVPGAQTRFAGAALKIWRARIEHGMSAAPGAVCAADAQGVVVACGVDALRVTELQRAGGKRLPAGAFLSGTKLARGARLEAAGG